MENENVARPDLSIPDAVREITDASRQMFAAGERIATDLETIERRFQHAADWREQLSERPWLIIAGALLGGVVLWRLFR
jgi:hypothetical protein